MLKLLQVALLLTLVNLADSTGYCYNKKCWSLTRGYFDCDQEYNNCEDDKCVSEFDFDNPSEWCGFDEYCDHRDHSGKAYCRQKSFLERNYMYILIFIGSGLIVMISMASCCCHCLRNHCSNEGVLAPAEEDTGYHTQVPQSPQVQYTGEAFLYQSHYPSQPDGRFPHPPPEGYSPHPEGHPPHPPHPEGYPPHPPHSPHPEGYPPHPTAPGYTEPPPQYTAQPEHYASPPPPYQEPGTSTGHKT